MNILTILNDVLGQSGFLQKASFFGTQDPDDIQMINIANRTAYEIYNFYTWSGLRKTHEVEMIVATIIDLQTFEETAVPHYFYPLPADFKSTIADSAWEQDGSRKVELSTPEDRWYMYKFSAFSDGGTLRARIHAGLKEAPLAVNPAGTGFIEVRDPEGGEKFLFEYISNGPIIPENTAEDPKDRFTADTDTWLLDDQLLTLGIQYHWALTKMLPQAQDWKANYDQKMNEAISRDVPAKTIGGFPDSDWLTRRSPYYPLYRK